jgi:proton-dependent oligopeptide transporter, POT family
VNTKQPKALYFLAFTETWERFGFYCIQALLVLFLTKSLHFTDAKANGLYSAVSGLLYASPVIGGWLADRFLGFRKAIIFGAILYACGYIMMFSHASYGFYLALSLLIIANGYFKANISSLLGSLYQKGDVRRDSGFTLFYLGINIGTLLGPIAASVLTERYNFHYGFGVSGIGILIGLATFLYGRRYLGKHGVLPQYLEARQPGHRPKHLHHFVIYAISLCAVLGLTFLLTFDTAIEIALTTFCVVAIIYAISLSFKLQNKFERNKMLALLIFYCFSAVFWAFYMQIFTSVTLFSERNVDRWVFGWHIPTAMLQSIIPVFLILFSPLAARVWLRLSQSKYNPSISLKFAYGQLFQALSYLVLIIGMTFSHQAVVALFWLVISGLLRAIGELALSPIGLSIVTKLSPVKYVGMMMGIWFLSIAGGLILANPLADIAAVPKALKNNPVESLPYYAHAFSWYAIISAITALILIFATPWFKRMTGEAEIKGQAAKG